MPHQLPQLPGGRRRDPRLGLLASAAAEVERPTARPRPLALLQVEHGPDTRHRDGSVTLPRREPDPLGRAYPVLTTLTAPALRLESPGLATTVCGAAVSDRNPVPGGDRSKADAGAREAAS